MQVLELAVQGQRTVEELALAHPAVEQRAVQRAAWAGLIRTKQLYSFDVEQWLDGDPAGDAFAARLSPSWSASTSCSRHTD